MIDTHCHLTDQAFDADREDVLQRAWHAGLVAVVSIASDAVDAGRAWDLARSDPRIFCTAGIHPHVAERATRADLDQIREMARRPGVVAVGETGLDFHYDNSPRDVQRRIFDWHLQLAADSGRPIVVHSRNADDDMDAMIRGAAGVRGVLHCFTGGPAILETALAAGWYVSYGGMVTFRNFAGGALLRSVPADRLLLETDSPYLAPVPHRGQRNEPAFVVHAAAAVAAACGRPVEQLGAETTANARRFFNLGDMETG